MGVPFPTTGWPLAQVKAPLSTRYAISRELLGLPTRCLVAQKVKNLQAVQEIQVRFLGQEDPLGKGMATHSSGLPGEFLAQWSL